MKITIVSFITLLGILVLSRLLPLPPNYEPLLGIAVVLPFITNNKILGVYSINDDKLNKKNEEQFQKNLLKLIPKHDLVIVADFGHGFISKSAAKIISKKSKSMALNAQINAANIGYHTMDKYEQVQCIVINETELRHQFREKEGSLIPLMKKLSIKHKTMNV